MEQPTCKTCPYWEHDNENEYPKGLCKRHAPQALPCSREAVWTGYPFASWTETESTEWCGEHPDFPAYLESLKPQPPNNASSQPFPFGELSIRIQNILENNGIDTLNGSINDLANLSLRKFRNAPNVGKVTIQEVIMFANKHGITMKP